MNVVTNLWLTRYFGGVLFVGGGISLTFCLNPLTPIWSKSFSEVNKYSNRYLGICECEYIKLEISK